MKTPERFNRAVAALVKGYLNGTLAKGTCAACACGNIVAASLGETIERGIFSSAYRWSTAKDYSAWGVYVRGVDHLIGEQQVVATGYSREEFALIEKAFEFNTSIWHYEYGAHTPEQIDADQYNGLVAVFNLLCELDGIADPAPYVALLDKSTPALP